MTESSSFIITEGEDMRGKIITFENKTGECCWTGGIRKFRVIKKKTKCIVELLEQENFTAEFIGSLDDSHERCIGDSARQFTYRCLEWIKKHFISFYKKGVIRGIVSPNPYDEEQTERWAEYERETLKELGFQPED